MDFYSGDLAVLNGAHVAQQDADTRQAQINQAYLLGLAQNRANENATASRERSATRGYQSEDTRTQAQRDAAMRGYDVQSMLGMDTNEVARQRLAAEQDTERKKLDNVTWLAKYNATVLPEATRATLASNEANTRMLTQAQLDAAKLGVPKDYILGQIGQRDADMKSSQALADQLNKTVRKGFWDFRAPNAETQLTSMKGLLAAQKLDGQLTVIPDPDGYPLVVPRAQPQIPLGQPNPAPGNPPPSDKPVLLPEPKPLRDGNGFYRMRNKANPGLQAAVPDMGQLNHYKTQGWEPIYESP